MELNFSHKGTDFLLQLFQDAFFRYSARIVRRNEDESENFSSEAIIVDTCQGKIEVYEDVDVFGGRELVVEEEIDDEEEVSEKTDQEMLLLMRDFLIKFYLENKKS